MNPDPAKYGYDPEKVPEIPCLIRKEKIRQGSVSGGPDPGPFRTDDVPARALRAGGQVSIILATIHGPPYPDPGALRGLDPGPPRERSSSPRSPGPLVF